MQMATSMKVNFSKTNPMVMEFINKKVERYTKVTGNNTSQTAKANNILKTVQSTKESSKMD